MARSSTSGIGRPKGVPNKATTNAREAIARLVDDFAPKMAEWLEKIEAEQGPMAAWKCMQDVIEYHIPKLQRTEVEMSGTVGVRRAADMTDDELAALATRANHK